MVIAIGRIPLRTISTIANKDWAYFILLLQSKPDKVRVIENIVIFM
jgi:hypothetical protein